jgi:F420-non-reducing hydrogenase small subunit
MSPKLQFAFYWGASCGGCEVAVLDINERILDVAALADIVLWPLVVDGKYKDIEGMPDKNIDVSFINGGIRNSETERIVKLLRDKSKYVVSFGACAGQGGVPGLANQYGSGPIKKYVYTKTASTVNPNATLPQERTLMKEGEVELPDFYDRVFPLDEIINVDYYLPGCPPTSESVFKAVTAIAEGKLPPAGSVLGSDKTLCDECKRERNNERCIKKFYRPHEIIPDPALCLLEQGIICCGPATRAGCKATCIDANMPCRGCFGPPPNVADQGAKMLSAVSSLIDSNDEAEIDSIISALKDPMGIFYQFGLAKSILKGSLKAIYSGGEKRKSQRLKGFFSLTYRVLDSPKGGGSEAKNIGMGGMLLTTSSELAPGTKLALDIQIPHDPHPLMLIGLVIESAEVVKDSVYDTRIEFLSVDDKHKDMISVAVDRQGRMVK